MSDEVCLLSSEGEKVFVEKKVALMSKTICNMMEASKGDDDSAQAENYFKEHPIPLSKVSKATLDKVIEWCNYHKDDGPRVPVPDGKKGPPPHVVSDWDQDFLKTSNNDEFGDLCALFTAADYLAVGDLFNDISQTIANMIHGKKAKDLAEEFHIQCDLTAEEIVEIRKKNAWCDEQM